MEPLLSRAVLLVFDPSEMLLFLINFVAAVVVITRAFRRVVVMRRCASFGMRAAACLMAIGSLAVMLADVEGSISLSWPQTILLAGVSVHCLFDRRYGPRRVETARLAAAQDAAGA